MTDSIALFRWLLALALLQAFSARPVSRILGRAAPSLGVPLFFLLWSYLHWIGAILRPGGEAFPVWLTAAAAGALFLLFGEGIRRSPEERPGGLEDAIVFWGVFLGALALRSLTPELEHTEKLPDMAVFTSVLEARHFPPQDAWLSGHALNYYYFGYLLFAPFVRLLSLPPEWAFNLIVPTLAGWTASGVYALVRGLPAPRRVGLFSALTVVALGNWGWIKEIKGGAGFASRTWWSSTRILPGTINEFPYFTLTLGDLHPHFLALPWIALVVLLSINLRHAADVRERRATFLLGLLTALAVGLHYPMNAWGLPLVSLLTACFLLRHWILLLLVGGASVLFYLPYWLSYHGPQVPLRWVPWDLKSPILPFLLHWGIFLLPLLAIAASAIPILSVRDRWRSLAAVIVGAALGGPAGALVAGLSYVLFRSSAEVRRRPEGILLAVGLAAIFFCEVFFLDDSYGREFDRMNTVFKHYIMAWVLLAAAVPVWVWRWRNRLFARQRMVGVLAVLTLLGGSVYPLLATSGWTSLRKAPRTLDALRFWEEAYPGERGAVEWLRKQSAPTDVVLEAFGEAYHHRGRISALTGRPTVLGWANHVRVLRRDGNALVVERQEDFARVLRTPKPKVFEAFLAKYHVRWIVLGAEEKKAFGPALAGIVRSYPTVYQSDGMGVHEVRAGVLH